MPSLFRNTGEQEKEQLDTNPTSLTFGTRRWLVTGVDAAACPVPPPASSNFRSALIAELVYRDDCVNGELPNGVTYRLEEGFRTSVVSQQDADNQARAYFAANRQAFANANDSCLPDPANAYRCEYNTGGCWTGNLIFADGRVELYTTNEQKTTCFVPGAPDPGNPQNICFEP